MKMALVTVQRSPSSSSPSSSNSSSSRIFRCIAIFIDGILIRVLARIKCVFFMDSPPSPPIAAAAV
ncbi:hypothetical protein B566_EDAN003967 [Ephemera danica]|nr:hypothetical protein B566_EDAN003967 [Ephemera danica]